MEHEYDAYCHNCGAPAADDSTCDYCHEHVCDQCRSEDPVNHWRICDYCRALCEEDGKRIDAIVPVLNKDGQGRELLDEMTEYYVPGFWLLDERDETGSAELREKAERHARSLRGIEDAA